jgi:CBS domain-containing protein
LGLIRDFVVDSGGDHPNTLDLKLNGITPFVDGARIMALYAGVTETSTIRRIRAVGEVWRMDPAQVEAWVEAFLYIQFLRLRLQHEQSRKGIALSNRVDPGTLNNLDRQILKEAFRQAKKLQGSLDNYFKF